jgi:hypothetical protein
MSSCSSLVPSRVFKNPDEQVLIPTDHFLQVNTCNSQRKQVSAYITPEILGQGVAREFDRETTTAFPLSYEDNSATRTESVFFDRKEQKEDLVLPLGKAGEREFSITKGRLEGETPMQVSACTQR